MRACRLTKMLRSAGSTSVSSDRVTGTVDESPRAPMDQDDDDDDDAKTSVDSNSSVESVMKRNKTDVVYGNMWSAKSTAVGSLGRLVKRTWDKLAEERTYTETVQPDRVVRPSDLTDSERSAAERNLEEANARFNAVHRQLLVEIDAVRAAERVLNPCELVKPAVVAMAVSAPSTSWTIHEFAAAPFPNFIRAMNETFEACYTNKEKTDNRLSKRKRITNSTAAAKPQG